jgi:pSer/pThr/pTyr-binding forkhead associated (FHA) protein
MSRRDTISATYMSGPLDGKTLTWPLPENDGELAIQIGRREGSHILLDYDTQVSRVHARVVYNPLTDTLLLEDLGSRNGTFYGQQRVREHDPVQIRAGDLFRVGRTWMRIDPFEDSSEPASEEELPF